MLKKIYDAFPLSYFEPATKYNPLDPTGWCIDDKKSVNVFLTISEICGKLILNYAGGCQEEPTEIFVNFLLNGKLPSCSIPFNPKNVKGITFGYGNWNYFCAIKNEVPTLKVSCGIPPSHNLRITLYRSKKKGFILDLCVMEE